MTTAYRTEAPDEGLKELIYIGDDGLFYPTVCKENKHRLAKLDNKPLGLNKNNGRIRYKGEQYLLNRVMYWFVTGKWPDIVDFFDGDSSNYRFSNLRDVTKTENKISKSSGKYGINRRIRKDGKEYYYVYFCVNGKNKFIGSYKDELSALFAAWKIRDIMFPNTVPVPEKIKDIVNRIQNS